MRSPALFPQDRNVVAADADMVQVRLSEMQLRRPRQWGACWLADRLWRDLELDRFFAERLPRSRKGTRWDHVPQVLVSYWLTASSSRAKACAARGGRPERPGRKAADNGAVRFAHERAFAPRAVGLDQTSFAVRQNPSASEHGVRAASSRYGGRHCAVIGGRLRRNWHTILYIVDRYNQL